MFPMGDMLPILSPTKDNLLFSEDIEREELNPSKGAIVKRNIVPQEYN
jgi:hypothetical protein